MKYALSIGLPGILKAENCYLGAFEAHRICSRKKLLDLRGFSSTSRFRVLLPTLWP